MMRTRKAPISGSRMAVAIVSHAHPSISKGGAEISAYTLFRGLKALGVPVTFIAACPEPQADRVVLAGPDEHIITYDPQGYSHLFHIGAATPILKLQALIDRLEPAVVNFHHFLGFGVNALHAIQRPGRRIVLTLHEYLAICHHHGQMITNPSRLLCNRASPEGCSTCFPAIGAEKFAIRQVEFREAFAACDAFISPSNFLRSRFSDWGLAPDRIHVIENGVAIERPAPQLRQRSDRWTFGYFGQINPFKGVDLLLDALDLIADDPSAAKLINIRVHGNFVGAVEAIETRMKSLISRSAVQYNGPYRNTDVVNLMSDCDYVVVPSKWWENSPLVIQEAYLAGRPLIAPGIGGMAEKIMNGVTGLHFRYGDAADLARIMRSAADREVHETLTRGLPTPASGTDMADGYMRLFHSLGAAATPGTTAGTDERAVRKLSRK